MVAFCGTRCGCVGCVPPLQFSTGSSNLLKLWGLCHPGGWWEDKIWLKILESSPVDHTGPFFLDSTGVSTVHRPRPRSPVPVYFLHNWNHTGFCDRFLTQLWSGVGAGEELQLQSQQGQELSASAVSRQLILKMNGEDQTMDHTNIHTSD